MSSKSIGIAIFRERISLCFTRCFYDGSFDEHSWISQNVYTSWYLVSLSDSLQRNDTCNFKRVLSHVTRSARWKMSFYISVHGKSTERGKWPWNLFYEQGFTIGEPILPIRSDISTSAFLPSNPSEKLQNLPANPNSLSPSLDLAPEINPSSRRSWHGVSRSGETRRLAGCRCEGPARGEVTAEVTSVGLQAERKRAC